jgi:hypothetical protein
LQHGCEIAFARGKVKSRPLESLLQVAYGLQLRPHLSEGIASDC